MNRINNNYIEKYLDNLAVFPNSNHMKKMLKVASLEGIPVLRQTVACLLNVIIKSHKPRNVLEIGTSIGYSTLVMLSAMGESGHVTTIEIDAKQFKRARQNFEECGVIDRITMFEGDAGDILHFMEGNYDLIFLDGPKAQYINYLPHCIRLLNVGGLLICDDVLFYGMIASDKLIHRRRITIVKRMRKFLNEITNHPQLDTTILPLGDGITISYKKEEPGNGNA